MADIKEKHTVLIAGFVILIIVLVIIFLLSSAHILHSDQIIILVILAIGIIVFLTLISESVNNKKFAQELDHGQIRKAIAISFTIVYIFMLATYYGGTYAQLTRGNVSSNNNSMQIFNMESGEGPVSTISNIYNNFLYIYIIIIGFYFGSRAVEGFSDAQKTKAEGISNPENVLKNRLANGEITPEDYDKLISKMRSEPEQE
jgi:uncharacterized membrane protein